MRVRTPSEQELADRIRGHLAARRGDAEVAIAWSGYLAGLIEWGVIDPGAHGRLVALLPADAGIRATEEILLGVEDDPAG